jgi:uncharacterized protein YkwD
MFVMATLLALVATQAFATDDATRAAILAKHNEYRALHGVPPLKVNQALNKYAEERLDIVTQQNGLSAGHTGLKAGYGENLGWYAGSTQPSLPTAVETTVRGWYNEIANYDFTNPRFTSGTGHFSQVVWKSTTEVGCAVRMISPRAGQPMYAVYVACVYTPPGNVLTQFPANVLPRK